MLQHLAAALAADRRGNVLLLTALALVPLLMAVGIGIDYARAMVATSRLNAVADAAALAGVDAGLINASVANTTTVARQLFTAQAAVVPDIRFTAATGLTVTVTNAPGAGIARKVTVVWRAASPNLFSGILGLATLPISGVAKASAAKAPNIDFTLLLDKSPSMLLPDSSTGLLSIYNITGCAFACHEQFPQSDGITVRNALGRTIFLDARYYNARGAGVGVWYAVNTANGQVFNAAGRAIGTGARLSTTALTYVATNRRGITVAGYLADGYWLTHNFARAWPGRGTISLRIQDLTTATQSLITLARQMAATNGVTYRMQLAGFDWTRAGASSPIKTYTGLTNVGAMSSASVPNLDAAMDWWYANGMPTPSSNIDDRATELHRALLAVNQALPAPGSGAATSTPQKVLMLVTDGMEDEWVDGGRWHRELSSPALADCAAIKARGITIAILYTQYLPQSLTGNWWSQVNVAPWLGRVLPALQQCASPARDGTPLVYAVGADQNIAVALGSLFATALANARLVQ